MRTLSGVFSSGMNEGLSDERKMRNIASRFLEGDKSNQLPQEMSLKIRQYIVLTRDGRTNWNTAQVPHDLELSTRDENDAQCLQT